MAACARITRARLAVSITLLAVIALGVWLIVRAVDAPVTFPYGELRVGVDPSSPPFAAISPDGQLFGLEIDLAHELGVRLNLPVRFVALGFDGLYDALKTDQVDALIAGIVIDNTRLNDIHFSQPYYDAGLVLVSNRGIREMQQLPGHKLAYEFGSEADSEARAWLRRVLAFETLPYEQQQNALSAAERGDADAALVNSVNARLYLQEHPEFNAEMHYIASIPYAIATQARRPETNAIVRATLQAIIDEGTLAEITSRWLS